MHIEVKHKLKKSLKFSYHVVIGSKDIVLRNTLERNFEQKKV